MNTATAENKVMYISQAENFSKIPGSPIAYWVSPAFGKNFDNSSFSDFSNVITGMTIGDNNKYLRFWYEIVFNTIGIGYNSIDAIFSDGKYWIPYSKGGERRNWYGNNEMVVNWKHKNNFNRAKTTLQHLYLREALTWPFITPGNFSARLLTVGFLWDVAGSPCFFDDEELEKYALGLLCSKVTNLTLKIINPTINVQAVDIQHLPFIYDEERKDLVVSMVNECVKDAQLDWDCVETSWDFKKHPLI